MSNKKMGMYNEKVMEHFTNPKNVGVIEDAELVYEVLIGQLQCFF